MKSLASVIPGTPIEDCRYLLSMKCQETILKTAEPSVIKSMASCLTIHTISRLALESVQVRCYGMKCYTFIIHLLLLFSAIDECSTTADCVGGAVCINIAERPGFLCQCPPGYTGDGRNSGSSCTGETFVECRIVNERTQFSLSSIACSFCTGSRYVKQISIHAKSADHGVS